MFRHISYHKYRFGDEVDTTAMKSKLAVILAGECILSHSGAVNLIPGDYVNLEGYFSKKELSKGRVSSIKYRVTSSEMEVCLLSFEFVDKLPEEFR